MTVLVAGVELEAVATALGEEYDVERVETLAAVRSALEGVEAVVAGDLSDASASAVLETVRSGVYCPSETPVVRLGDDTETAVSEGYDAVVSRGDPEELHSALEVTRRADEYREAVADLFEACRASADGESSDEELRAAFERADSAFEDLHTSAGRTPYERVFGFDVPPDERPVEDDRER